VVESAAFCVACVVGYRELWMAAMERRESAGRAAQREVIVASRAGVARDIVLMFVVWWMCEPESDRPSHPSKETTAR